MSAANAIANWIAGSAQRQASAFMTTLDTDFRRWSAVTAVTGNGVDPTGNALIGETSLFHNALTP